MKTFKEDKMVKVLLDKARSHVQLATMDLDFADMAYEEMSVAMRMAISKKGYTEKDVIDEIYEYTGILNQESVVTNYIYAIRDFKWKYKQESGV